MGLILAGVAALASIVAAWTGVKSYRLQKAEADRIKRLTEIRAEIGKRDGRQQH